jgi:hypothetical protein
MNQDQQQERREQFWRDGWNVGRDDDTPCTPEAPHLDSLSSAQARRAWRDQ